MFLISFIEFILQLVVNAIVNQCRYYFKQLIFSFRLTDSFNSSFSFHGIKNMYRFYISIDVVPFSFRFYSYFDISVLRLFLDFDLTNICNVHFETVM